MSKVLEKESHSYYVKELVNNYNKYKEDLKTNENDKRQKAIDNLRFIES